METKRFSAVDMRVVKMVCKSRKCTLRMDSQAFMRRTTSYSADKEFNEGIAKRNHR